MHLIQSAALNKLPFRKGEFGSNLNSNLEKNSNLV